MMITPQRALKTVFRHVRPLAPARYALHEATGCCLAEDVRADRDQPASDRSAMDGFAVRASDLARLPRALRLVGEVAAGSPARPRVRPGTCVRILTGARVPPGADTVVMVEQTTETDGVVTFDGPAKAGANIRRQGEEATKGAVLLRKGRILRPVRIGLCAAVGKAHVRVFPRPRVAVICTGRELRDTGSRVRAHELRDSNGPALLAALRSGGYTDVTCGITKDDAGTITAKLRRAAARCDVVIITGGVSVGKYDLVPEALARVGATIRFHGVKMKPGKPQVFATLPHNRHIFGLPGNPLSVMMGFYEFVLPALRRMSGLAPALCQPCLQVRLAGAVRSKGGRVHYVPARLIRRVGEPKAVPLRSHGSADLAAASEADGAVVIPADVGDMPAGQLVEFRPWRELP